MQADYVIVGSGSAGSALAFRLGEAGRSVIVVEYGGSDWGPFIQMPAALSYPMNMAALRLGLPHRARAAPRRPGAGDAPRQGARRLLLDQRHGLRPRPPAGTSTTGPRSAPTAGPGPTSRPTSSAWSTGTAATPTGAATTARCTSPAARAATRSTTASSRPAPRPASSSPTTTTAPSRKASARWSRPSGAAGAGRPPTPTCARRSRAATSRVVHGLATRVVIADGRATGVEIARGDAREVIEARAEVIVSASPINTPKLLMLSGIGPAAHLAEHGLPVLADRPGVGANLQDHLELYIQRRSLKPITLYSHYNYPAMARIGAQWLLAKIGLGTSNQFEVRRLRPLRAGRRLPRHPVPLPAARGPLRRPRRGPGPRLPGPRRPDALALPRHHPPEEPPTRSPPRRSASTTWRTRRTGATSATASG